MPPRSRRRIRACPWSSGCSSRAPRPSIPTASRSWSRAPDGEEISRAVGQGGALSEEERSRISLTRRASISLILNFDGLVFPTYGDYQIVIQWDTRCARRCSSTASIAALDLNGCAVSVGLTFMSVLGEQLRAARLRHGVTQRSLARRAGTTQAAISRIESGAESPSFERFEQLLLVLGERPVLHTAPLAHDLGPEDLASREAADTGAAARGIGVVEPHGDAARARRSEGEGEGAAVGLTEGAPSAALDVAELMATLHRHGIDFTIIGGVAVQVHGHRRTTKDLDVIPAPNHENLTRLHAALVELGRRTPETFPARARRPAAGRPTCDDIAVLTALEAP